MNRKNLHKFFIATANGRGWLTFVKCLSVLTVLLMPLSGKASHIVGGELNYTCLGGNEYEITLTVYRDCFYGLADFDDPAAVGIFDGNGFYVDSLMLPLSTIDTLIPFLSDTCLFVPEDVCVSTTTYKRVVTLPFRSSGYVLAYQRCCRNQTINNIVSPDNTGATFMVEISETALQSCNSNAKFEAWPPIFICVNEPINFSQAAIDVDGDSIVYKLCTPLSAGDSLNNRPQPPLRPPYNQVVFNEPTYTVNNMLGFGNPLTINEKTGVLTGRPTVKGQYVVGICIEEYRDGQLISTTRRDFQYNVGDCGVTKSAFTIPDLQCENLTVNFENQSENTENFIWHFNDPNNPGATSTEANPSYTYADTGRYTILLVTEPGSECVDSSYQDIYLKNATINTSFEYENIFCNTDSIELQFTDTSVDTYSTPIKWEWELSDGQSSSERNPVFVIDASQNLTVRLTVTSDDDCSDVSEQVLDINLSDLPPFNLPADTLVCGNSYTLSAGSAASVNYSWASDENFNNIISNSANLEITPDGQQTVYVRAINAIGCERTSSVNLRGNIIDVKVEPMDFLCLGESQTITVVNNDADDNLTYQWSPLTEIASGANTATPTFQPTSVGEKTATVTVTDEFGCQVQESISYRVLDTDMPADFVSVQKCDGLVVDFEYDGTNLDYYTWDFGDNGTANGAAVTHTFASAGTYMVRLVPNDGLPCNLPTLQQEVTVYDQLRSIDFDFQYNACQNDAIIAFSNLSQNLQGEVESYSWQFSNGVSSNQVNPTILVATSQTLTVDVTMTTTDGCTATLSRNIDVDVVDFSLPATQINCDGTPTQLNPNADLNYSYQWSPAASLDNAFAPSPMANPTENTTYTVTVTNGACQISSQVRLLVSNVTTSQLSDSLVVCSGGIQLNAGVSDNPNFEYSWTPVAGLNDPTAANPIANPAETTVYTAVISDKTNACEVSRVIKAVVPEVPLSAGIDFEYEECLESAVIQLRDRSETSEGFIVKWDWQLSNGMQFNSRNPVATFDESQSVEVSLTVENLNGCIDTRTTQLEVQLLELNTPEEVDLCIGGSTQLNPNPNTNYTYKWFPTNSLNDATLANPTASPGKTTEYTVTIIDDLLQCQATKKVIAKVPTYETELDFDWAYESCGEDAILQFTDQSSNTEIDIAAWSWNFSNNIATSTQSPSIKVDESQTVQVDLTIELEDGCVFTLPTQEVEVELISFEPVANYAICTDEAVTLNPDGDNTLSYSWSPEASLSNANVVSPVADPASTTTYTVVASRNTANGLCAVERNVEVVVAPPLSIALNATDSSFCERSFLLEATTTNATGIRWSLDENFSTIIGEGNQLMTTPDRATVYYVEISDDNGCSTSSSATLSSFALDYEIQNNAIACFGDTTALSVFNNVEGDILSYQWAPDLNVVDGRFESTVLVNPLEDEVFFVNIENEFGCMATETVNVTVTNVSDLLQVEALPSKIAPGETSLLFVTDVPDWTYTWVPANTLNNPDIASPLARPTETTTYVVIVEDENGCVGQRVLTVEVDGGQCEEPFIFVPKGFTPNDDGR
ncbi:MAG: PKD domain-containing protein, partial [Bacteroidota bacterium]